MTFKQYQTQERIRHSASLLTATDKKISDIAAECGFIDRRYFTELFKEHIGLTPQEYRNRKSGKQE